VLDPFLGTGTTMVAAAKCGRNSTGVELDPYYWQLAAERLKSMLASIDSDRTLELLRNWEKA